MSEEKRQSGRTTKQIATAPQGAVYVWVNGHLDYPKNLAKDLYRDDLDIRSPSILDTKHSLAGIRKHVIIDHACELSRGQLANWMEHNKRISLSANRLTAEYVRERNDALSAIDMDWLRKQMPFATDDNVRIAACHKARYEATGIRRKLRLESAEWLKEHNMGRFVGPLLPEGELPE